MHSRNTNSPPSFRFTHATYTSERGGAAPTAQKTKGNKTQKAIPQRADAL